MSDKVLKFIEEYQQYDLSGESEAEIAMAVVQPLLSHLGWNVAGLPRAKEVVPQYAVRGGVVDYALVIDQKPEVFIEAKKGGERLENHYEQLLTYAFKRGVKLGVLTNGTSWWFYLPMLDVGFEYRRCHAAEIGNQNAAEVAKVFEDLLGRENVVSGQAVKTAENLYKSHRVVIALPIAWGELVKDTIPNLLIERTEILCGYKPSPPEVDAFVSRICLTPASEPVSERELIPATKRPPAGSKPLAFTFNGRRKLVEHWKDILRELSDIIYKDHKERFEETVLNLEGKSKLKFSRDRSGFRYPPYHIDGANVFVDIGGDSKLVVEKAHELPQHFSYEDKELYYELRD